MPGFPLIEASVKSILFSAVLMFASAAHAEGFVARCGSTECTAYRVDLKSDTLLLVDRDAQGERYKNAGGLEERIRVSGRRLRFVTNAGIFDRGFKPLGLFVSGGKELVPLNTAAGSGNFYLRPNGVFSVSGSSASIVETDEYHPATIPTLATQSGPLLLRAGAINPQFQKASRNEHIRSGVGVKDGTTVLFAISNQPITFYDFALFFREQLGCTDALYLDGYISKMFVPELGRFEREGDFAALFAVY